MPSNGFKCLIETQQTILKCQLCGETFRKRDARSDEHAALGVTLTTFQIGDRVRCKFNTSHNQFIVYKDLKGVIINIAFNTDWLTCKYLLNQEHDIRYLFDYQIQADGGHVYTRCREIELIEAVHPTTTYEAGKKVFTPAEFRREMQKDPSYKQYVTPLFTH